MGAKQTKWNLFLLLFCLVFILIPVFSTAQLIHKKVNRYDENGKRTGLWVNYWDEDEKIPMSKNHFKDDIHYYWHGKWKFYDQDRKLIRKTIFKDGVLIEENFINQAE